MQYELTNTQEITSTIYTIKSPYTNLFYRIQINYLKDITEGWLYVDDEGKSTFYCRVYE